MGVLNEELIMTPKYFTSFANPHKVPLMKMSDKPHCLLTARSEKHANGFCWH